MTVQSDTRPNNLRHISRDVGYRFIDVDPMLERVTVAISKTGWELDYIAERSGVGVSTLRNWMGGKTKKPLNVTLDAVFFALGYERVTRKIGKSRLIERGNNA